MCYKRSNTYVLITVSYLILTGSSKAICQKFTEHLWCKKTRPRFYWLFEQTQKAPKFYNNLAIWVKFKLNGKFNLLLVTVFILYLNISSPIMLSMPLLVKTIIMLNAESNKQIWLKSSVKQSLFVHIGMLGISELMFYLNLPKNKEVLSISCLLNL